MHCYSLLESAVFLFAHQDDEYGVFHAISSEIEIGREVWCLYLTDGGDKSELRNIESLKVLRGLGVSESNILFIGKEYYVSDCSLVAKLEILAPHIENLFRNIPMLKVVYIPAWEGGHPDHDALHFLVVHLMNDLGRIEDVYQFPLYHGYNCKKFFYRVMSPLPDNGMVIRQFIPILCRIKYLLKCFRYRSQAVSWIGLFPFVAISYLINGYQCLQKTCFNRLYKRPHEGTLYYEARRFSTWEELHRKCCEFRNRLN
jgi:hypothetical protein